MTIHPSADVLVHKKSGQFMLISYALDRTIGAPVSVGEVTYLSPEEMKKDGLTVVLEDLRCFSKRDASEGSVFEKMSDGAHRKFHREHILVAIELTSPSVLMLSPMHTRGGGHVGKMEERIRFKVSSGNEEFYKALLGAFEKSD